VRAGDGDGDGAERALMERGFGVEEGAHRLRVPGACRVRRPPWQEVAEKEDTEEAAAAEAIFWGNGGWWAVRVGLFCI